MYAKQYYYKEIRNRRYLIGYRNNFDKCVTEEMFFKCLKSVTEEELNALENGRTIYRGNVCFCIDDKCKYIKRLETEKERELRIRGEYEISQRDRHLDWALKNKTNMMSNIERNGVFLAEKWDEDIQAVIYGYNEMEYVFVYKHNEYGRECLAFYHRNKY